MAYWENLDASWSSTDDKMYRKKGKIEKLEVNERNPVVKGRLIYGRRKFTYVRKVEYIVSNLSLTRGPFDK